MAEEPEETLQIPFGTKQLAAVLCRPTVPLKDAGLILTHGAGGDMNFRQLLSLAHASAAKGFLCLRFTCKGLNLAYRVKAYHAVWDFLKTKFPTIKHIFLGGSATCLSEMKSLLLYHCDKQVLPSGHVTGQICGEATCLQSMGSRAAAALLRQLSDGREDAAQGLICLSFPLHPPAQTDAHHQRSQDLRQLPQQTPVLFVSGTQDDMCSRDLLDKTIKNMKAQVDVLWLNGGSHGLAVKGRSEDSVMEEVNTYITTWMSQQVAR